MSKAEFWAIAVTGFLFILLAICARGSDKQCWLPEGCKSNVTGSVQYTTNPFIYEAVNEVAEADEVDGNMNLNINTPFVMTYERVDHHSVRGVGCHVLLRVDSLKPKEGLR